MNRRIFVIHPTIDEPKNTMELMLNDGYEIISEQATGNAVIYIIEKK